MKDLESYTLAEALVHWGEPAAAAEMMHLATKGCGEPRITLLSAEEAKDVLRYRELRETLGGELIEKLRKGTLVATGFDVRAPFDAPAVRIPPDRWHTLLPNYDDSSAADAGVMITGILVRERDATPTTTNVIKSSEEVGRTTSTGPDLGRIRLEIDRTTRRVRFDDINLRLSPRSFDLLLILAEAAVDTGAPVSGRDIEARLWSVPLGKKAVNDAIGKLKSELVKQRVDEVTVRLAIENLRARGYRLTLAPGEIHIVG